MDRLIGSLIQWITRAMDQSRDLPLRVLRDLRGEIAYNLTP